MSLTSLNGCDQYVAIRAGGLRELNLRDTELGVWAARFLERSASTLTSIDFRCPFFALLLRLFALLGISQTISYLIFTHGPEVCTPPHCRQRASI
jgi:hypothetical protein